MSVNKVLLLGRLGSEPELKFTPAGQAVCNFSVATSEKWTDKTGNKQEKTEWTRIVVWGKIAELCNQYLKKGQQVFVEGKLATRSWDDATSGQKRYATEVVAANVQFLGGAAGAGAGASAEAPGAQAPGAQASVPMQSQEYDSAFTADDIPF